MTVNELKDKLSLELLCQGDMNAECTGCYSGDLLSWVMSKAEAGDIWLTVMGNINAVAVSVLCDCACIILTENASLDDAARTKADMQGVTIMRSEKNAYQLGVEISKLI